MTIDDFLKTASTDENPLCKVCNQYKQAQEFNIQRISKKTGKTIYQYACKICVRAREKKLRELNPVKYKEKRKIKKTLCRNNRRDFIIKYLSTHPCVDCSISDIRVLDFDHIGTEKNNNISEITRQGSLTQLEQEIKLCEVVCANCHRIRTMTRGNHYRHISVEQGFKFF